MKRAPARTKDDPLHMYSERKHCLTEDEIGLTDELFTNIDLDKNGTIEFDELSILHGFDKVASPDP